MRATHVSSAKTARHRRTVPLCSPVFPLCAYALLPGAVDDEATGVIIAVGPAELVHGKAVKKTLTIPAWLNTLAERNGLNFSAILQRALKEELKLAE